MIHEPLISSSGERTTIGTAVEFNRNGEWVAGVVLAETRDRLTIAVGGNPAHRAHVARVTSGWRRLPKYLKCATRRRAHNTAMSIFTEGAQ